MSNSIVQTFTAGGTAIAMGAICKTPAAAVVATGNADIPFGVALEDIAANAEGLFCIFGECRVLASEAIAKGHAIMPAAAGKAADYVDDTGHVHCGEVIDAASGDGSLVRANFRVMVDAAA